MSKLQEASEAKEASGSSRGCGCRGHGEPVRAGKSPADPQAQPSHSTRNKRGLVDHSTDGSPCCCGGKTASRTGGKAT